MPRKPGKVAFYRALLRSAKADLRYHQTMNKVSASVLKEGIRKAREIGEYMRDFQREIRELKAKKK